MSDIGPLLQAVLNEYMTGDEEEGETSLTDGEVMALNGRIADKARDFWQEEAGRFLKTTLSRYQQAIEVYEDFGEGATVYLDKSDKLVEALEDGAPAYDLKPGFLQGQTRRAIPFTPLKDVRTVSSNSDASSWRHPGFRGLHLEQVVQDHIERVIIPRELNRLFNK